MGKGKFVVNFMIFLGWICCVIGFILVLYGNWDATSDRELTLPGLILALNLPYTYGFCYIVKAACKYLELHQNGSMSNEPKRKVYSDKLTDLYR